MVVSTTAGEYPASSTRGSTLLNIPPEQAEVKVPTCAVTWMVGALGVLLSAAAAGCWFWYGNEPDMIVEPSPTTWRITVPEETKDEWKDWKICAIIPYEERWCRGAPVDFASAEIAGSPPVPDGWKDFNLAASKRGLPQDCSSPWVAVADGSHKPSNPPYLEWKFESETSVGCFKVQYLGRGDGTRSKITTIVQINKDGNWIKTTRQPRSDWFLRNDMVENLNTDWTPESRANPLPFTLLSVSIVLTIVGAAVVIFALPIVACAVSADQTHRTDLREEVRTGSALVVACPQSQWTAFVEEEWGPGGVVHGEQFPWWMWVIFTVLACVVGVVLIKVKSLGKRVPVDWETCFYIAVPSVVAIMFLMWVATKLARRIRYNRLRRDRYPVVFGTAVLYFAETHVLTNTILHSNMATSSSAAKTCLVVKYKDGDEECRMSVPIPEARLDEVKAFLQANADAYGWAGERADIELGAANAQAQPEGESPGVVVVTPAVVQVVEAAPA